jgi:hypothetical protein
MCRTGTAQHSVSGTGFGNRKPAGGTSRKRYPSWWPQPFAISMRRDSRSSAMPVTIEVPQLLSELALCWRGARGTRGARPMGHSQTPCTMAWYERTTRSAGRLSATWSRRGRSAWSLFPKPWDMVTTMTVSGRSFRLTKAVGERESKHLGGDGVLQFGESTGLFRSAEIVRTRLPFLSGSSRLDKPLDVSTERRGSYGSCVVPALLQAVRAGAAATLDAFPSGPILTVVSSFTGL